MAKLIRTPDECGYRLVKQGCLHPHWKGKIHPCKPRGEDNFPGCCPLEDVPVYSRACAPCDFNPNKH